MDEMLAEYGLDTTTAGLLLIGVCAVGFFLVGGGGDPAPPCIVDLHPDQMKYMLAKEASFASSSNEGKGIRMILDYLREASDDEMRAILDEKPKHASGFEPLEIDIHDQQFEWLEDKGIKMGTEETSERYKPLGKVARACIDWAMRMEAEGKDKNYELYETVRCLNC